MFTLCERPRIRKLLQLMLAALLATTTCLNTLLLSPQRAYAEDADIGSVGYLSYVGPLLEDKPNKNPSGTVALSNHMEITVGNTVLVAICSEHELDTPPLGTAVRKTGTITNDDIIPKKMPSAPPYNLRSSTHACSFFCRNNSKLASPPSSTLQSPQRPKSSKNQADTVRSTY